MELTATHTFPLVSFITVNYRQDALTLQLLGSLKQLSYPNWECIVVNNDSDPGTLETAVSSMPNIRFFHTGKNLGFAGGNNVGIKNAQGKYIYLINNDTEVGSHLLEPIVEIFEKDPKVGMVSSKILYFDHKEIIQYAGSTELNSITTRNKTLGDGEEDQGQYDYTANTAFIHGASMMVSRAVIEDIGLMWDDFFLYYEEYDWCQRCKKAGYKIIYCGLSYIYHKESMSTGKNSPLKTFYLTRNRLIFARRNYSFLRVLLGTFYFSIIALPVRSARHLLKGEMAQFRALWKGFTAGLLLKKLSSENRY